MVERWLFTDGDRLRTGYVEAVGTHPDRRRHGYGSQVMPRVTAHIGSSFELGALGPGIHAFYERLGPAPLARPDGGAHRSRRGQDPRGGRERAGAPHGYVGFLGADRLRVAPRDVW